MRPIYYRNKLVTILEGIDAVKTSTISLLTTDVGTQSLTGVSRDAMRETLKKPHEEAKKLVGSILATQYVRVD